MNTNGIPENMVAETTNLDIRDIQDPIFDNEIKVSRVFEKSILMDLIVCPLLKRFYPPNLLTARELFAYFR